MDQLKGKVAAVTGATGSIGRGIAFRFAREGAKIALIDRDAAKGAALAKEIQTAGGMATFIRADVAAQGDAQRAVDAAANAYGRLDVNIADAVSTDWSLQGLTRAAAVEWGKYQILTNLLIPALIDIPEFQQYRAENPAYVDGLIMQMPLRRLGDSVEDLGGAALLLASDEGCFIIGHPVFADGGHHINTATFRPRARQA
jgi:3-oxoacyl-[acyl-carrier protein] reductase